MKLFSLRVFRNTELVSLLIGALVLTLILAVIFYFLPGRKNKEERKDSFLLFVIAGIYAMISFHRLGSMKMPDSTWQPVTTPQQIVLELTGPTQFSEILTFCGEGDNNSNWHYYQFGTHDVLVEGSDDLEQWDTLTWLTKENIFRYIAHYGYWDYRYVRLTSSNGDDTLTEIAFFGENGGKPLPVRINQDDHADSQYPASLIIDEQDQIPLEITYYDNSYFDEVYHPRNAWEIANGQYLYPHVHPLLGTELMAVSILLFGNNPFAWRLPGALCGVGILFVLHHILVLLFEKRKTALFGTALCACDFMHITTSRIATLEPMSVLAILVMFDLMVQYAKTSFYVVPFRKTILMLLVCGVSMGLAMATKWTACYSAVGLALILFYTLYQRWKEYQAWKKSGHEVPEGSAIDRFPEYLSKTLLWCVLFFIIIPVVIYFVVYIPAHISRYPYSIETVIDYTTFIYRYHANLDAHHTFESVWWQWLLDIRPIWFYSDTGNDGIFYTISCFTNPLLSIAGIPAILYAFYLTLAEKKKNALFISIGYLTALLPWLLVTRCIFSYHFYPTSMFMIMAITLSYDVLTRKYPELKTLFIVFLIFVVIVFLVFMPVTCGFGTTRQYAESLELLDSWSFQ